MFYRGWLVQVRHGREVTALCKCIHILWASFVCRTRAYKVKAGKKEADLWLCLHTPRDRDGTQYRVQLYCSVPSLVASATWVRPMGTLKGGEACGTPQQPCVLQQGWFIRDTEKTLPACLFHLPSSLGLPWDKPFHTLQKLNWARWRLHVTGLGLPVETGDPGGVQVNYKIVSLDTALELLCTLSSWTAARVIYSPGRSACRAQSCCRGSLNHHISSCHPQHLVSAFWQCELQQTAQRANSKAPFLNPKEIKYNA